MSGAIKVTPLYYDRETGKFSAERPRRAREREERSFVKVPLAWVKLLRHARHVSTYHLAIHLLHKSWRAADGAVPASNIDAGVAGISRRSKWRALGELEQLGLITIQRTGKRGGRAPIVRLRT